MSEWQVYVNTLDASQTRVVARRDNQEDAEAYAEELDGEYEVLEGDETVPYPDNGLNFVVEVDVNGLHESPSEDNVTTDEEN
jgi:hypothetical protein